MGVAERVRSSANPPKILSAGMRRDDAKTLLDTMSRLIQVAGAEDIVSGCDRFQIRPSPCEGLT